MSKNPINILMLEDNDFDYDLIKRQLNALSRPHCIVRAASEEEFKTLLQEKKPDVILSDFSLPSYTGLEALKYAKSTFRYIPFIFVSGTIGEELAVESLKQGAVDYVLKENLAKLVPAVDRALRESKEKIKRKKAEEKLKVKVKELKTLVYRISHDFKAPVCTIRGATNLYWDRKDVNMQEQDLCVSIIEKVTDKMDSILFNLSSFQHLYNSKLTLSDIHLHEIWQKVESVLKDDEKFGQVQISLDIQEDAHVQSEKNFIFFILYNLVHNAVTFSDKTKPAANISCRLQSTESGIGIEVEDNGVGIPDEIKANVCDMFFRGNTASRGAGLGLYIIKNGLDLLNGSLEIHSKEGEGTKVAIEIPAQELIAFTDSWEES